MDTQDPYLSLLKKCLTASIYEESAWSVLQTSRTPEQRSLKYPVLYLRSLTRSCFARLLRSFGLSAFKRSAFDAAARAEGRDWPCFGYTMVGHRRLDNIQMCVEDVLKNDVPGDLIETGVWRGGSSIFMRALLKAHGVADRSVWVADSFEGLPKPSSKSDGDDLSGVDILMVSLEQVKANFERFGLLDDQVKFLQGWFCDTLPKAPVEQLAILRLDGDLYSSTMDALQNLYHKMSPGGYVIVDDYFSWEACRRAVTDFRQQRSIESEIKPVDWTGAYWQVERS